MTAAALRNEKERFIFTKLNEKISGDTVMKYLGKTIPQCFVSGATHAGVKMIPVDLNVENILPSNMAYLDEKYLKTNRNVEFSFINISKEIDDKKVTVTFLAPAYTHKKIIDQAKLKLDALVNQIEKEELNGELVYGIWDYLMFNHVKGIFEVKVEKDGLAFSVEAQFAVTKLMMVSQSRLSNISGIVK